MIDHINFVSACSHPLTPIFVLMSPNDPLLNNSRPSFDNLSPNDPIFKVSLKFQFIFEKIAENVPNVYFAWNIYRNFSYFSVFDPLFWVFSLDYPLFWRNPLTERHLLLSRFLIIPVTLKLSGPGISKTCNYQDWWSKTNVAAFLILQ